ncbi:MAG: DUF6544 family protein [Mycobacteriales bacterium]
MTPDAGEATEPNTATGAGADTVPAAARRWLAHVLPPGAPRLTTVRLEMRGHLRLGSWMPFHAVQVLSPPDGFVWAARVGWRPSVIRGVDRYANGRGEQRWLRGPVPLLHGTGPDVDRGLAGRLAAEAVFAPAAFLGAAWEPSEYPGEAVARWRIGGADERVRLRVDGDGRLRWVSLSRWGNPPGEPFGRYPFGVRVDAEAAFDGVTIPSVVRAGWWWDTPRWARGEFYRATILAATFPDPG